MAPSSDPGADPRALGQLLRDRRARLRLAAARHPGDPAFTALIADLQRDSEQVRAWWPRHDVRDIGSGTKKLRHPTLGPADYTHVVLQIADQPDQTLVTYSLAG